MKRSHETMSTGGDVSTLAVQEVLDRIRFDEASRRGSVIDVVALVTGKDFRHASNAWNELSRSFPEVSQKVGHLRFPGRGQRDTPVAPVSTLVEVAWLCPGRAAKEFRRQGAVTLCRALGGDLSLVEEIEQRHGEVAGTETQAALLEGTGVTPAEANSGTSTELASSSSSQLQMLQQLPLEQRQQMILRIFNAQLAREDFAFKSEVLQRFEPHDARDAIFKQDWQRQLAQQALALFSPGAAARGRDITVSEVLQKLQHAEGLKVPRRMHHQLCIKAGQRAVAAYRTLHGREPETVERYVDGAVRRVKLYWQQDWDLVEQAVRDTARDMGMVHDQ